MTWWWQELDAITILHESIQINASNNSNQCSQAAALVFSSTKVWVSYVHRWLSNTMSMCTIWVHTRLMIRHQQVVCRAKAAMLWRASSQDFTRVAIYLVVQMNLSRWKAVCCRQLTLLDLQTLTTAVKVSKSCPYLTNQVLNQKFTIKKIIIIDILLCYS